MNSKKAILLATLNKDKKYEIVNLFSDMSIKILGLDNFPEIDDIPESGETLLENSLIKSREAHRITGLPSLADDTGLEVDLLNGAPGVYSARYAGENVTYDENVNKLLKEFSFFKFICIDVANGYREVFLNFVKKVREAFPEKIIIAGNVATREMTEALILAGADIVKVGIGPGSVCTTRKVAGVGYPQLSAISECADAAHGLNGHVMSDGGCSSPGDVAKAFAAGADFVMLGGMLAGQEGN